MKRFFLLLMACVLTVPGMARADCSNPAATAGIVQYFSDQSMMVYCDGTDWIAMGRGASGDCDNIGDTCADGSVYAGISPDGNEPMYTTPADAGTLTWNNGTTNWIDTTMVNCTDGTPGTASSCQTGEANTTLLVGLSDAASPYAAAGHCDGLSAHGHADWYLPAQDELDVLYDNKAAIGGFNISGSYPAGYYWSSEGGNISARAQRFSDGLQGHDNKNNGLSVRCVRRGTPGTSLSSGLVGHWKLDETSGTTATDSGSGGNDGTMLGGLNAGNDSVAGKVGTALEFDGNNDYINVGTAINSNICSVASFSAWVKPDSFSDDEGIIANYNGEGALDGFALRQMNANTIRFILTKDIGLNYRGRDATGLNLQAGRWYHVAGIWDGTLANSGFKIYVNGVQRDNADASGGTVSGCDVSVDPMRIGSIVYGAGPNYFDGKIDDVRIYNRALSAGEIAQLHTCTTPGKVEYNQDDHVMEFCSDTDVHAMGPTGTDPGTTNLVGHWALDETSGTTASDSAGSNDGTMGGGLDAGNDSLTGIVDTALDFDGSDDYVDLGDIDLTGDWSISIWFNADDLTPTYSNLFMKRYTYGFEFYDDDLRFQIGEGGSWDAYVESPNIVTGEWRHALMTYDSSTDLLRAYMDGALIGSDVGIMTNSNYDLLIGAWESGTEHFDGTIDDARIYDRVLSASEVLWLYQQRNQEPCPNIGDVCPDGSVYAGLSPDGNVPMYTTRCDDGMTWNGSSCTGTRSSPCWNNCNASGHTQTNLYSAITGESNTTNLASMDADSSTAGTQDHVAAKTCNDLSQDGHTDWYLPAQDELNVLYTNNVAIGNFETSGTYYWASTQFSPTGAWRQRFSDGTQNNFNKNFTNAVRCVRKGTQLHRCSSPDGVEGTMIYNADHSVAQYCNGQEWVGIGK